MDTTLGFSQMMPVLMQDIPQNDEVFANIYTELNDPANGHGVYSYRGGLTTPPCTEIVHWNLLDQPMRISKNQIDRLYDIILCYVERSTCRYASIANEYGSTSRPPQPIHGRTIIHRCNIGTNSETNATAQDSDGADIDTMTVPLPPAVDVDDKALSYQRTSASQGTGSNRRAILAFVAMLFPWFAASLGLICYYFLSRYFHHLPYTAVLFLIGTIIGIVSNVYGRTMNLNSILNMNNGLNVNNQLGISISMWENINAELLLLGFLPGLLFRDAYGLNFHLFGQSLMQCWIFAFPM